jgi:hypothetical protein
MQVKLIFIGKGIDSTCTLSDQKILNDNMAMQCAEVMTFVSILYPIQQKLPYIQL